MSIEAINAIGFLAPTQEIKLENNPVSSTGFAAWLDKQANSVNDKIVNSETQLRQLAAGEVENLHQVMIAMEEAKLSFQFALQVRNRLLEGYQDILRMQI